MKCYIGTKIVRAEPQNEPPRGGDSVLMVDEFGKTREGYKVVYEDGYVSWSPKETFERAYREVTDQERKLLK